jgi:hypothetical protein
LRDFRNVLRGRVGSQCSLRVDLAGDTTRLRFTASLARSRPEAEPRRRWERLLFILGLGLAKLDRDRLLPPELLIHTSNRAIGRLVVSRLGERH